MLYDFDPVMSGFEQPMTMSPAGQLAAFQGQQPGYEAPTRDRPLVGGDPYVPFPVIGAGAGLPGLGLEQYQRQPPAVIPAAIPAVAGALGIGLPGWLLGLAGVATAGYGMYQALGGGEGGGLFGMNILGGDEGMIPGTQIGLGGPGLAEPGPGTGWNLLKEWHVNYDWGRLQYYLIQKIGSQSRTSNRWIAMYNTRSKQWKAWRWVPPKLAVIGKNMPRHQMLTRLRRNLSRHSADARTLLKITSPGSLAKAKRHGHHYHKRN